jgi:nucleoside-diphosphate-sugar epimerase
MRDLNIAKGVYTSTLAVFSDTKGQLVYESYYHAGPWLSEYDRTKWEAHYNVALPMIKAGLPLVVVQPGLVYGPGDTSVVRQTLIQYLQRKLPMLPKKTAFAWAHVEDIARGHILAMEKGQVGESYIIAGPTHTLIEGMQIAEAITGIKGPRFYMPVSVMRGMAAMMGLLDKILPLPQTYTGEGLRSTAGVTYLGDNAKARRELGYQPRALQTGLRQTLEYEMQLLNIPSRLQRNQTTAS